MVGLVGGLAGMICAMVNGSQSSSTKYMVERCMSMFCLYELSDRLVLGDIKCWNKYGEFCKSTFAY